MKLCEKIVMLRKAGGMSQEDLAEKLGVSRQAVSRWEVGSAMPDAANLLQLSKLFHVTADYLLDDDYGCEQSIPQVREVNIDHSNLMLFFTIVLEVLNLLMQFMTVVIMDRNLFFCVLSFIPFLCIIGGFEWGFQKRKDRAKRAQLAFRKRFYIISAWLGTYFPVRLIVTLFVSFDWGPNSSWIRECTILAIYICTAALLTLSIEKRDIREKD